MKPLIPHFGSHEEFGGVKDMLHHLKEKLGEFRKSLGGEDDDDHRKHGGRRHHFPFFHHIFGGHKEDDD